MSELLHYLDMVWYPIGMAVYVYTWCRFGFHSKQHVIAWRCTTGGQLLISSGRADLVGVIIFAILFLFALLTKPDDDDDDDDDDGGKPVGLELKEKARRLIENLKNQLPSPIPQPA